MRRSLLSLGSLVSGSLAAAVCLLASSPAVASPSPHPRLLFSAADVPSLRARLAGPLAPIAAALHAGVDFPFDTGAFPKTADLAYQYFDDRRALADTVASYAFASLAFGDARSNELARAYLVGVCNFDNWVFPETQDSAEPDLNLGHFLMSVALAYDWTYDSLTDPERAQCRAKVASEGAKMYAAAKLPESGASAWWISEYLQNHYWVNHAGLGMAALAFDGELGASANVDTHAWLATATNAMKNAHDVLDIIKGGAWHEGIGYVNYGLDALLPFSLANERNASGPDYANNTLVTDYARLRLYGMPPAKAHAREYVVYGDFSGYQDDNTLAFIRYVAKTKKDGLAAWYADTYTKDETMSAGGLTSWPPSQRGLITSAILFDDAHDAAIATPPPGADGAHPVRGAWDLDYFASDLSLMLSRSGWVDGDTMLGFKSGVFGGHANFDRLKTNGAPGGTLDFGHDHDDDMTVFLFADSEWLTTSVPAYFIGRANGSPEGNKTRYANSLLVDGRGQIGEGVRTGEITASPWFYDRVSTVPFKASTVHYSFSLAAGSGLYDRAMGLDAFGRAILFVDRAIPVVRDVIHASKPHRFDVVWHAIDGVTRDGNWLALAAKNDRVLGAKIVAPAAFDVATEAQSAVHTDKFDPDGELTAAMVHPVTDGPAVTFLTALVPARASTWAARAKVDAIDPSVPDRGVTISGAHAPSSLTGTRALADVSDVVFNDEPAQTSAASGISVTGMAGVRGTVGGKIARVMLAAGKKLVVDGTPWIEILKDAPSSLEVEPMADGVSDGAVRLSGEITSARIYAPRARKVTYNGKDVGFDRDGEFVVVPNAGGSLGGNGGDAGDGRADAGSGGSSQSGPSSPQDSAGCACNAATSHAPTKSSILLAIVTLLGIALRFTAFTARREDAKVRR